MHLPILTKTLMTTGAFPRCGSLATIVHDGVVDINYVIEDHVEAPTRPCGDDKMAGVIGPIYVGLQGEKIFVLIIIESEFV